MPRKPHFAARLARYLAREDGVALALSIGVIVVMGMVSTTMLAYSSQNSGTASRSKEDVVAFSLAEAGINNAVSVLSNPANDPTNPALLASRTESYTLGTDTWWGTFDSASSTWTITSQGEVRNPTGPSAAPVRRRITAHVTVAGSAGPTGPLMNPAWNYVVATRTGNPCDMTLSSTVSAGAPLYTMGNLCLGSLSRVTTGPLAVRGTLSVAVDASVGLLAAPIARADVAGGCGGHPCSSSDRVFATTITQTPPSLTPPVADWDYWYANAAPGPRHACETVSGTVPVFDNNSARDKSVTTVFSLTPASSYTCRVGPPGNPTGELSWDAPTRVLTIRGTIFIDGQAKIDNGRLNTYVGQGVLYVSGAFAVANGSKMCAVVSGTDCDLTPGAWDPNVNLFAVVSNGNGGIGVLAGNSVQLGCLDRLQGALYGTYAVYFSAGATGAKHQGPIVASTIVLSSAAETKPFATLRTVPVGLPGQSPTARRVDPPRDFSA